MQTVTAKDIAERIKRRGEPLQAAVDRLRNWTKEGLIKPTGEKNPGKGRSRRYSKRAVFEAVLLQVLIDCTGKTAVAAAADFLPPIKEAVTSEAWAAKCGGLLVVFGHSFDDDGSLVDGPKGDLLKMISLIGPQDIHIIIHLERIFRRAFPEGV